MKKFVTIGTKIPKELAIKFEKLAKERKRTVSKLMREEIEEVVDSKQRIVVDDEFVYDKRKDEIIWYGILENGIKWEIQPVDIQTAKKWIEQISTCLEERNKIKHTLKFRRKVKRKR